MKDGRTIAGGSVGRDTTGLYSTPKDCTMALLDWWKVPTTTRMFEPCGGEYAIGSVLEERGYFVQAMDIAPKHSAVWEGDFLLQSRNKTDLTDHTIITNPPFKLMQEFVEKGFELGAVRQAHLMKSNAFSAARRTDFFNRYRPSFKLDLTWRPDILGMGNPTMDVCWLVWERPCSQVCQFDLLPRPINKH